jgi:polyhydroxyalkanoate synthesis regulator phasin
MAGLGDIVQKAFYLGVGLAASAGEQAGEKISTLRVQADEMVAKGEITTEEARKLVDDMLKSAQQQNLNQAEGNPTDRPQKNQEPRRIEIIADGDEPSPAKDDVSDMRKQVEALQEELKRMKNS